MFDLRISRAILPAFVMLSFVACQPEGESQKLGDPAADVDPEIEPQALRPVKVGVDDYFIVTGPDYRKCAAPMCGGHFVGRVNTSVSRCADGTWQETCHMFDVDISQLNYDKATENKARVAIQNGQALVRGGLESAPFDTFPKADILVATEVWIGVTGNTPDGHFSRVDDTGILCITFPCPYFVERSLNTNLVDNLGGVDLSTSGASAAQQADGVEELNDTGLLIAGTHTIITGPAGTMNSLEASEFYSRL